MLIIVDDKPPLSAAYVAHPTGSKWYYIAGDDEIVTMMAIPSAVPPISPTIAVSGP